jgi:hypothetical protein
MSSEKNGPQEKDWWEQEDEGYNRDSKVNTVFLWEDETKRIIKERLGVVDKDTDDDSGIEGEEKESMRMMVKKELMNLRRTMMMMMSTMTMTIMKGTKTVVPVEKKRDWKLELGR